MREGTRIKPHASMTSECVHVCVYLSGDGGCGVSWREGAEDTAHEELQVLLTSLL